MKQMRNLTLKYVHLEKLSRDGARPKVNPEMRPFLTNLKQEKNKDGGANG